MNDTPVATEANAKSAATHPTIDTTKTEPRGGMDSHPMSPTIQVQAPDEEMNITPSILGPMQNPAHLFNTQPMLRGDEAYSYSTAASSTIDGPARDTATQYSGEDVLMQGDDGWIATMGALDNPGFWTNGMVSLPINSLGDPSDFMSFVASRIQLAKSPRYGLASADLNGYEHLPPQ